MSTLSTHKPVDSSEIEPSVDTECDRTKQTNAATSRIRMSMISPFYLTTVNIVCYLDGRRVTCRTVHNPVPVTEKRKSITTHVLQWRRREWQQKESDDDC